MPSYHKLITIFVSLNLLLISSVNTSAQHGPFTVVDSITHNFQLDELRLWDAILGQTNLTNVANRENTTLTDVYRHFGKCLNESNYGKIDTVRPFSHHLTHQILEINNTQEDASRLLAQKKYIELKHLVDKIIQNVPRKISNIFDETSKSEFLDYLREKSDYCEANKQAHNVISDFYSTVAESLIKGYMLTQMSYMLSAIRGSKQKYYSTSFELRESFTSHYRTLEANIHQIVKNFSGEIWVCDDLKRNDSYTEITNFVQGYVDNEVNFNPNGSCTRSCSDYTSTRNYGCKNDTLCQINYLDKNKTRCDGRITDCTFIESDMSLCANEDDEILNRRYNYIRYSSGKLLGKSQFCPEEVHLKSWIRWFVSCSYCFCYCDNEGPLSDRYFSLRKAVSNIDEHKVVTGIRLLKKNRIIHLFISERSLLPNGKVDAYPSNETWKSDYNFLIEDNGVESGIDYHTLTWQIPAIDLDILRAPKNNVITGVRFRVQKGRLLFEIRTTPYNHQTGKLLRELNGEKTTWRCNNNPEKTKINIGQADVPTRATRKSERDRRTNRFIEFTPTSIYKDAAQSTVPFIDTTPVEGQHPTPLAGAGIYYKTTPGYGGYIAPLIIPEDISIYNN